MSVVVTVVVVFVVVVVVVVVVVGVIVVVVVVVVVVGPPPYQLHLLLAHVKTTSILLGIYSTFVMSDHHKRPQNPLVEFVNSGLLILDLILGGGGGVGGGGGC